MSKYAIVGFTLFILMVQCQGQKLDVQAWTEDIDFYHQTLEERHINLYHTVSKEDFTKEVDLLKARLPELTKFQVIVELMRLTHSIGGGITDGHTSVPLWGLELHKYPIELFNFNGELRVVKAPVDQKQLLGKKLKSIDDVAIEEIYNQVSNLTPFTENEQSSKLRTTSYLLIGELLQALNVTQHIDKATFVFADDDGRELPTLMEAYAKEARDKMVYEDIAISHPKVKKPNAAKLPGLWYNGIHEDLTVYVRFQRYPSNWDEITEFGEEVLDFINTHNSENLIIDFRGNYGGDFYLGLLLPWSLNLADSIDWRNGVYVLTDRVTFSAATVNATQLRQLLNAKIVGEPTGGNPNGYQDMGQFELPNSNVLITYSKRNFQLQENDSPGLQPDVLITPQWEHHKKGVDTVLEWVLLDIEK